MCVVHLSISFPFVFFFSLELDQKVSERLIPQSVQQWISTSEREMKSKILDNVLEITHYKNLLVALLCCILPGESFSANEAQSRFFNYLNKKGIECKDNISSITQTLEELTSYSEVLSSLTHSFGTKVSNIYILCLTQQTMILFLCGHRGIASRSSQVL